MRTLLALAALAGCTTSAADPPPEAPWSPATHEAPGPPAPPRFDAPAMVAYHMRRHFDDLRAIERWLLAGDLRDARTLAFMLTRPETDPGMAPWCPELGQLTSAAWELVRAQTVDEALRQEARVALACARCHAHAQALPVFPPPPPAPPDQPTVAARMARHRWAVDRLWEGMVGATDPPWIQGLDVLAATPLPATPLANAPAFGQRLQTLAQQALATRSSASLDDRARTYGELLVTCAQCHRALHASPP